MRIPIGYIKKVLHTIQPNVPVGGLEVSDVALLYASFHPETRALKTISVKVPPGALEGGVVKNRQALSRALKELHDAITHTQDKRISVIVSISDANVYSQTFTLPPIDEASKKEAIRLNLETISPINFSNAYVGYQHIGEEPSGESEFIASFVDKTIITSLYEALKDNFFSPIAMEQRAYSLVRLLASLETTFDKKQSYFVMHINQDGLSFSVIRNGLLYFNRFVLWSAVAKELGGERQISLQKFEEVIVQESRRVINYFSSRFSEPIKTIYMIAPGLENQVTGIIQKNLPYHAQQITLKGYAPQSSWEASMGAALRGLFPRSKDFDISVAPEDAQQVFFHSQVLSFMGLWRNIAAVVFVVVLLSLLTVFSFLSSYETKLAADLGNLVATHNVSYLKELQRESSQFNTNVQRALQARTQQTHWERPLRSIFALADANASINRFFAQSLASSVVLNGEATSEQAAVAFKNKLESLGILSQVDLPLSAITTLSEGSIGFKITFKLIEAKL